uniref:GRASP55_65 domain-containing protein n=1 Tax=Rhabditophanes sp. KR3021 TaxID=114890 RepID=A0AC35U172_9BILA
MGNAESVSSFNGLSCGYRVQSETPAQEAHLEPFVDFIVCVANVRIEKDDNILKDALEKSINQPLQLTVFSIKTQSLRQIKLVPRNCGTNEKLGAVLQFCTFEEATQNVYHVVDVKRGSPAHEAGLKSDTDYILGSDTIIRDFEGFVNLIQDNVGNNVKLYVYNTQGEGIRQVLIKPAYDEGHIIGYDGALGCQICNGLLHRIPAFSKNNAILSESIKRNSMDKNISEEVKAETLMMYNLNEYGVSFLSAEGKGYVLPTNVPDNEYQVRYGASPKFA